MQSNLAKIYNVKMSNFILKIEIAEMINKDQRIIGTIYSRIKKKKYD
jgi:hypothetical protein